MNDIDIMSRTIYGEAKANSIADAEAIACVIMNRCDYKNWPNTPAKVCKQPYQFSCWNPGDPNVERIMNAKGSWWQECQRIAARAANGEIEDKTKTSTHYHTPAVKPFWSKGKKPVYQTDGHKFFNDIDTPAPQSAKEALDQHKPLSQSRTIRGGQVSAAGTAGAALSELGSQVTGAAQNVQAIIPYLDVAKWVFLGLILVGVGITLYARWDDRQKGRN